MSNAIKTTVTEAPVQTYDSGTRGEIQDSLKAGNKSIQLKQVITKISEYPTKIVNNNFTEISFGQKVDSVNEYYQTENRVTWVDVSVDSWKNTGLEGKELDIKILEDFQVYLKSKPKARIYKTLSTSPILSEGQKSAIKAGLTSLDAIAEKQMVKYPETGEPILWNGLVQYKVLAFSESGKADVDLRVLENVNTTVEVVKAIEATPFAELQEESADLLSF
jgi:hypothetical protein